MSATGTATTLLFAPDPTQLSTIAGAAMLAGVAIYAISKDKRISLKYEDQYRNAELSIG
ncbi:hypothetical protein [Nostoc parmelioides]|uniref:LPXTG cell wall anchor domain-containing protein n=1 Tax=Nostoc parmelioides FACHB-3921 TaxID=2692909 RepID=A0ABR8BQ07_9NOSO|nr:hypothetical protein [Nostoc parmelioides]MBD2255404.1 hypothetical protein [Nostoc parmelioides FACHB-3921]